MGHFAGSTTFRENASIARPVCFKCGAPMWLTRIQPVKPGLARRTLECPRCQNRITEVIELERAAR
jgi:DNA-directed RNA polymerase subunit RPC12/RpoP